MHRIQTALLNLSRQQDLGSMSLRQIAELIGASNKPQIVKHHLLQLQKAGMMQVDIKAGVIKPVDRGFHRKQAVNFFYSLPIIGAANCGPAQIVAEERVEGYLKVSGKMLPRRKSGLYILVADGPSMNKAEVRDGLTIEDGDFVVVDSTYSSPRNGDIVVAVIDGLATIKHYRQDKENDRVVLEADSTEKFLPIFIHEDDDFVVSGKVIDIIKKA
jgi:SOS-response transcriptional repressor LexA